MKKIFLSATLIGVLASCSQNDVQEIAQSPNEIQFSTLNDKVTRHANDNKSNYQVYAKLTGTGTPTAWFMNEVLAPGAAGIANPGFNNNTTGDAIVSTKKYYWPVNTAWTLNFYAYAPSTVATVADLANEKLPITYTVPTSTTAADAQEDFTIAIKKTFTAVPGDKNVHLQFKHMLTKITIKNPVLTADLTAAGYTIELKAGQFPSLGVVNVKGDIEATTAPATVAGTTPWTVWSNLKDAAGNTATSGSVKTSYEGSNNYNILPQPAAGTTITLPVVIKKDGVVVFEGPVTYTVKAADIPNGTGTADDNKFLPGKNYAVTLTINPDSDNGGGEPIFGSVITFSSEVADWDTVNPGVTQP